MRRYLYLYFTLVALDTAAFAQTASQDQSALPASRQQQAPVQPQLGRRKDSDQAVPAARYSPLAAQGGYSRGRTSPLEAMLHALNPRDVNLGAAWEERRRAWLENAGANRYFWYSFGATILVILSWFALAWMHNDRVRERWQLAEHAADALRYGEYCKRKAKEAIDRYNLHIETCNRVIEAGESGMATPETANLEDYKRELQRLKSDNDAKELQVTRLSEQLEQKATELNSLTERVTAAEQRLKTRSVAGSETGNAALVERIQRLEAENRRLKQRKVTAKVTTTADNGSGGGKLMLVAVQSFGSIWTARCARTVTEGTNLARRGAYYNTTGVLAGDMLRNRSCTYGHVRVDECTGFHPQVAERFIHRVFESQGVTAGNGCNKLFLRQVVPAGTRPDVYLFRIRPVDAGWLDRDGPWRCDAAQVVSFSEGNGQQEILIALPPFGWVRGAQGTFCAEPRRDKPWMAALSRAER